MRILHTSDWHFGKTLEMYSRIDEQRQFVDELVGIAEEQKIDLVLVAGDIYDTTNPTVAAEQLFFEAIKRLAGDGRRVVIVIAGNHDSPGRITAAEPVAQEQGIILVGKPGDQVAVGDYGFYSVMDSGAGFFEIRIRDEKAVVLSMPYPSEKTLGEVLVGLDGEAVRDEKELQRSYSDKIGAILSQNEQKFRQDTVNLVIGHFYIRGGENSGSERAIELGGIYAVDEDALPKTADYIAMGHLHRAWHVNKGNIYYSGSPIQFRKSEAIDSKFVFVLDIYAGGKPDVRKVPLKNYKPIEVWTVGSIEEALAKCAAFSKSDCWVYLEIESDRPMTQAEAKRIHNLKKYIVEIKLATRENETEELVIDEDVKSVEDEFSDYYREQRKITPSDEILLLFAELRNRLRKEDDFHETNSIGD